MSLARLVHIVLLLLAVLACGTTGYVVIEGWSAFDALYMTVTTLASVGYGEVHPLSVAGRVFTMVLIALGLGAVLYGLSAITAFWVEGDLSHFWEKRKMSRRIADLAEHIIVCGGGDTGRHIARELLATKTPFVCVELDPAQEPALRKTGEILYLLGDATDAEVLRLARIDRARGLITSMPSDKDNLFTILTARELNPRLRIVSRVLSEESRPKLLKAGADAIVSNKGIGALRLVSELVRPSAVGVIDAMIREGGSVRVEEFAVGDKVAGRPLAAVRLRERAGIVVFAMRSAATRRYEFNPAADRVLLAGDVLIGCADGEQAAEARRLLTEV